MFAKRQSLVFLLTLTVIISVAVRGQDPEDYFGQDEVYDDYFDDDDNPGAIGDENYDMASDSSSTTDPDENSEMASDDSSTTDPEKLIQKIDVSHSIVTIIDSDSMTSHVDARGSNIDIHTSLEDAEDLENTTVIDDSDLNLDNVDKVIENEVHELDIKLTPWIVEDINNPQDPRVIFNNRMKGLQNGMDALVHIMKDIAGNLGCENAGLCTAPFKKVRSGECLYMNLENRKTWPAAREYCQSLGADLAEPVTIKQDLEYIMRLAGTAMIRMGRDRLWVGGSDSNKEGSWRWMSGRQVAHDIGWTIDQPRDITGKEDCMAMIFTHPPGAEALSCFTRKPFVCQKHL